MLKHAITLGMFVASGLIFAVGSAGPTTLVGFAMLGFAIGMGDTVTIITEMRPRGYNGGE